MATLIKKFNLIAFFIGMLIGLFLGFYEPEKEYIYEEIIVNPNDTLWELTVNKSDNQYNTQELISKTLEVNGIDSNLHPGQKINLAIGVK